MKYVFMKGFRFFLLLFSVMMFDLDLKGTICILSGTYNNTSQFQNAVNSCGSSDTVVLTGTAQWSGNITVGVNRTLIVASTATINGTGSLTSTNNIIIKSGAVFTMSAGSTVTVGGNTFNGPLTLNGPAGITSSGGPLPVELISFYGRFVNDKITLRWQTASEYKNLGFDIERSFDGILFDKIGFVTGRGTTSELITYDFVDYKLISKITYYRLKQMDVDENYNYSKIIAVSSDISDLRANIYPQPVNDILFVQISEPAHYKIIDIRGGVQMEGVVNPWIDNIDVQKLFEGKYFMQFIFHSGQRKITPFLKF